MKNVASQELCNELYELSGWNYASRYRWEGSVLSDFAGGSDTAGVPAYELGYLIRKLPERRTDDIQSTVLLGRSTDNKGWSVVYEDLVCLAETPEDACAKLAIALCKRNAALAYFSGEEVV